MAGGRARRGEARTHDLDVVVRLDRVTAPKQARSTQSLQRILQALEVLLERKSFDGITMADIEAQSKCGIATIYARFRDKNSILAALHESISDRFIAQIDRQTDPERWRGRSLEEVSTVIFGGLVKHYARHRNLLRAIMLLDDTEVYERAAAMIRHASSRIHVVIAQSSGVDAKTFERRLDLGTKAAYALLQQRLVFHPIATGRATDDKEFAAELAFLVRLCAGRE